MSGLVLGLWRRSTGVLVFLLSGNMGVLVLLCIYCRIYYTSITFGTGGYSRSQGCTVRSAIQI
jgi:hypothetical protein